MRFNVVGIGEVLWDLLPNGPQLGGAPANFVYHAKILGANAKVVTRVGSDSLGREVLQRFIAMGIADSTVQVDPTASTGTATVLLEGAGVPQFTIHEDVAWDRLALTDTALKAAQEANAICFGTLAQRSKATRLVIQHLLSSVPLGSLRVFDINLRQKFYTNEVIEQSLDLANVLKLNEQELPVLSQMFGLNGPMEQQIELLAKRFCLHVVALTRGDKGSVLYQGGHWSDLPGSAVRVVDTVGAGDSFTAALVMGLLCRMSLEDIHQVAADVADYVCCHQGAMPPLPECFRNIFASRNVRIQNTDPARASAKIRMTI